MLNRTSPTCFALLGVLLLLVAGVAPAASTAVPTTQERSVDGTATTSIETAPEITSVSTSGPATVSNSHEGFVFWSDEPFQINVSVTPPNGTMFDVCVRTNDSDRGPGCRTFGSRNETTVDHTFASDGWATSSSWTTELNITLHNSTAVLDQWQIPVTVVTRGGDVDSDGLTNQEEVNLSTSMFESDTDGDGIPDGTELNSHDTDPSLADTDGDGIPDGAEINRGTDPTDPDSDDDGLDDGAELSNSTDPRDADTDNDGLDDGREVEIGADPLSPNTDDDGIRDGKEVELGLDPTTQDSDGDMIDDDTERALGTNPKSAWTPLILTGEGLVLLFVGGLVVTRLEWKTDGGDTEDQTLFAVPDWVSDSLPRRGQDTPGATSAEPELETDSDTDTSADDSGRETVPDDRIWTDRDEVLALIQEHDGRLKQRDVVENTDWSESKVSRTLSAMEADNQISRIEIGREKIVTLYDEEPDVFSSDVD